jgi:hypothetical protein
VAQRSDRAAAMAGGVYVYGICRRRERAAPPSEGIGGADVDFLPHRDLAAIVTDVAGGRIRATRRDLIRHSNVLAAIFEGGQVLPLRFGTVYPDGAAVVDGLLEARYEELDDLLDALRGKVELNVKAFYEEEAVLAEVVAGDPRIARLREATIGKPAAATHALRLDLGQAVAQALDARRAADADAIIRRLHPLAESIVVDDQEVENLVVKAALLVERDVLDAVDGAMDDIAREQAGRINFKYVGPLPPHSFVALDLREPA